MGHPKGLIFCTVQGLPGQCLKAVLRGGGGGAGTQILCTEAGNERTTRTTRDTLRLHRMRAVHCCFRPFPADSRGAGTHWPEEVAYYLLTNVMGVVATPCQGRGLTMDRPLQHGSSHWKGRPTGHPAYEAIVASCETIISWFGSPGHTGCPVPVRRSFCIVSQFSSVTSLTVLLFIVVIFRECE